jgi:hypothetical protein
LKFHDFPGFPGPVRTLRLIYIILLFTVYILIIDKVSIKVRSLSTMLTIHQQFISLFF